MRNKKLLGTAAFIGLLTWTGCQSSKGYILEGTVDNAADGDTVELIYFDGMQPQIVQTTLVKDGKFVLEGKQDTAAMRYLSYRPINRKGTSVELILENARLSVHLTPGTYQYDIKGSPANERWAAFHNEDEQLCGQSMDIYHALQDSTLTPDKRAELEQQDRDLSAKIEQLRIDFARKEIQTAAGAYTLQMFGDRFPDTTVVNLIGQVPPMYMTAELQGIKEQYEQMQRTAIGQPFTDFTMQTPNGEKLSITDIAKAHKVTMIDFWASWCGPCRAEMPHVKTAYEKFHNQGFEIIGVSLDNNAEAWKKAIDQLKLSWPQMSDLKGWNCEGARLYGVSAIPATVLIKDGKIVARDLRGDSLMTLLPTLLK